MSLDPSLGAHRLPHLSSTVIFRLFHPPALTSPLSRWRTCAFSSVTAVGPSQFRLLAESSRLAGFICLHHYGRAVHCRVKQGTVNTFPSLCSLAFPWRFLLPPVSCLQRFPRLFHFRRFCVGVPSWLRSGPPNSHLWLPPQSFLPHAPPSPSLS